MKIALIITGQSRTPFGYNTISEHIVQKFKPDIYCATWDEPLAKYLLNAFSMSAYKLIPVNHFKIVKQEFWNKYKTLQLNEDIKKGRFKLLNGQIGSNKNKMVIPDNAMRMFYLNSVGMSLVTEEYDCIIKIRPDIRVRTSTGMIDLTRPDTFFCSEMSYNSCNLRISDQLFYGSANTMRRVMNLWDTLPHYLIKSQDTKMNPTNPSWINPEDTLREYVKDECKIEVIPVSGLSFKIERGIPLELAPLLDCCNTLHKNLATITW